MATKELLAQLKLRKDTAASWTEKNPVIGNGEMIIVETSSGEQRFKVGDGEKTFTQLPYADENILSKIKNYTAGDGISISNEGVISSTGGTGGSDVFVIELNSLGENVTINTTFSEIKTAVTNNKAIQINADSDLILPAIEYLLSDTKIGFLVSSVDASGDYSVLWINSDNTVYWAYLTWPLFNTTSNALSNSGAAYWNATNKGWEIKDITSGSDVYMLNMVSNSNANTMKITNDFDEAVAAAESGKILRVKNTSEKNQITYYNISGFSSSTNASTNKTIATMLAKEDDEPRIIYTWNWDKETQEVNYSNVTSANEAGDTYFTPLLPASQYIDLEKAKIFDFKLPRIISNGLEFRYDTILLPLDTTKENSVTGNIYFTTDISDYLAGTTHNWDLVIATEDLAYLEDWKVNTTVDSNNYLITCRYILDPNGDEYQYTYDATDTEHKMVYIGKKGSGSSDVYILQDVTHDTLQAAYNAFCINHKAVYVTINGTYPVIDMELNDGATSFDDATDITVTFLIETTIVKFKYKNINNDSSITTEITSYDIQYGRYNLIDVSLGSLDIATNTYSNCSSIITYNELKSKLNENRLLAFNIDSEIIPITTIYQNSSSIQLYGDITPEFTINCTWNSSNSISGRLFGNPKINNFNMNSNSGVVYWDSNAGNFYLKEMTGTTYKAGNGISISNDGTISVTASKIYSGTSNAPSADLGENGDIYIQTEG